MKAAFILALACAYAVAAQRDDRSTGLVCVAPVTEEMRQMDHGDPTGKDKIAYTLEFSVQIGDRKPIPVPKERPEVVGDLRNDEIHRVVVRDGKRKIASFEFTFAARGSDELCLSYGPLYRR